MFWFSLVLVSVLVPLAVFALFTAFKPANRANRGGTLAVAGILSLWAAIAVWYAVVHVP